MTRALLLGAALLAAMSPGLAGAEGRKGDTSPFSHLRNLPPTPPPRPDGFTPSTSGGEGGTRTPAP